jgi:hypothetical protein
MSRRVKAQPLTEDEVRLFPELWSSMFHDTKSLMRLLRRLDYPVHRGVARFPERRALKLRRALAMGAEVNTPADVLQLSELTQDERKLTNRKFYGWATAHSPFRLQQIEGYLTGRPSAERIISERLWDTLWVPYPNHKQPQVGAGVIAATAHCAAQKAAGL